MSKDFQENLKDIDPEISKVQQIPSKINEKKSRHKNPMGKEKY